MYVIVTMIVLSVVLSLSALGRKGKNYIDHHRMTKKVSLDDYDAERKNIDKLMR